MDERFLIDQERAANAEKQNRKDRHEKNKGNVKSKNQKNIEPLQNSAGPNIPSTLDPPGVGGPYDALKFPDQLVKTMNQRPLRDLHGWDVKAVRKIPVALLEKVNADALADLPDEVLNKLSPKILDQLPDTCPFIENLSPNNKYKRPQRAFSSHQPTRPSQRAMAPLPPKANPVAGYKKICRIKKSNDGVSADYWLMRDGEGNIMEVEIKFCKRCKDGRFKCNSVDENHRSCSNCSKKGLQCSLDVEVDKPGDASGDDSMSMSGIDEDPPSPSKFSSTDQESCRQV